MFKNIKKIIFSLTLLAGIFALAGFALAAAPDVGLSFGEATGLSNADPRVVVSNIIRIALGFLGIIAIGLITYGGFLWMTAAGNEEKIATAKKLLVSAVIGLIIILSAFGIATFILNRLLEATGGTGTTTNQPPGGNIIPGNGGLGDSCNSSAFGSCTPVQNCSGGLFCANDCTCQIVGGAGSPCSAAAPECQKDDTKCNDNSFCDNTCICQAKGLVGDSCNDSADPAVCQANGNKCAADNFCDTTNTDPLKICTCQAGDGIGQNCDADPADGCQANQTICSNNLTCDPAAAPACSCQEFPIINWISPAGGLCANDNNKECRSDAECPDSTCNPNTPSAAVDNIISIGGKYFGATAGKVLFSDGANPVPSIAGKEPKNVNPVCVLYWSDSQVIIVVPTGAATGPLRIERADKKTDDTNDSRGPKIKDLQINNIKKPGLCLINPLTGKLSASVTYNGINFSAASAKFGNYENSIAGKNSSFDARTGLTGVPNIAAGKITTFVYNSDGNQVSNYYEFEKIAEPNTGPYIVSFEPKTGASGQYVAIRGDGFGNSRGVSKVYFGSATGVEAGYQFPEICADSVWSNKQIIVKVPEGIGNGNYILTIVFSNNKEISTSPNTFKVDSTLGLYPSLCKISPVLGQAGTTVDLWGEYFGEVEAATSKVRFSPNKDVTGFTVAFWHLDTESSGAIKPDKIETKVPVGASTGQVAVVKGSPALVGNGLNFQVGSCLDAAEADKPCGLQKCCPAGTYKAGNCVNDITDCAVNIPTSVYEFNFNTDFKPGQIFGSCLEKSKVLGTCNTGACPNSPGLCSLFPAGAQSQVVGNGCTDAVCNSKKGCENSACVYNKTINKCADKTASPCGVASSTKNISGNDVPTYCAAVKDSVSGVIKNVYVFDNSKESCPSGWTLGLNGSLRICISQKPDAVCVPCAAGFSCIGELPGPGVCAVPGDICPSGSVCQSDGQCKEDAEASCGCCCRKADEFKGQDCCLGLDCTGACGSNADANGGAYGSCSGCKTASGNQSDWDARCNCSGTTGKFCDIGDANFSNGVCRDCAQLSSTSDCSNHSGTCCVDNTKNNSCVSRIFGSKATDIFALVSAGGINYCKYKQCNSDTFSCSDKTINYATGTPPVINNPAGISYYASSTECTAKCKAPALLGADCQAITKGGACNNNVCSAPFGCMLDAGDSPLQCGFCCCDPSKSGTAEDACQGLGDNRNLACRVNQTPCSGYNRGLCCGCSASTDCGNAQLNGCGSDTCCRTRPGIEATVPADGATGVCTNAEIRATSTERMNIESFGGNVIVVGEYSENCPVGTVYLAAAGNGGQNKNILVRVAYQIYNKFSKPLSWLFGQKSLASAMPLATLNYCAIAGSVSGEQTGDNKTVLIFRPRSLLSANRKYFVIIRGDADLKNSSESVRSLWDIGMNIISFRYFSGSPVNNISAFNGIVYRGSYIWSFTTLADTTANPKGICVMDHAKVTPDSYLFQTTDNAPSGNEDDTSSAKKSFDTAVDSDKAFTVRALSSDGQILHSVSEYSWTWTWGIENSGVANFVSGVSFTDASGNPIADESGRLIRAVTGVTDNKTKVNATTTPTGTGVSPKTVNASADIYVFICNNPWPPIVNGTWRPWRDNFDANNCVSGTCGKMNYELYYCRDQGGGGPSADLPTISGNTTRGGSGDILKESYFFRQDVPQVDTIGLKAAAVASGGAVDLNWNAVPNGSTPAQEVINYKVYYGDKSGAPYASSKVVASSVLSTQIAGLQNDKIYYFSVTAVYKNGAESAYSKEVSFTPKDTAPPQTPSGLQAAASEDGNAINVSWATSTDDTVKYKLYYGVISGQYGSTQIISGIKSHNASFPVNKATAIYYINLTALDKYENESNPAGEIPFTPLTP